jgi:hypothetical protein
MPERSSDRLDCISAPGIVNRIGVASPLQSSNLNRLVSVEATNGTTM